MDISTWDDKCMQAFIRENASMFRVFAFRYLQDERRWMMYCRSLT